MWRWLLPSKPLGLGRWCHPTSEWYKTCDQARKGMLADYDNGFHPVPKKDEKKRQPTRDPVSVFSQEH